MIIMCSADLCRQILKHQPPALLTRLQQWSSDGDEVVISAITYAELVAGVLLTSDQARHMALVEAFCDRLDDVMPWNREAVDQYTAIQTAAMARGHALNMNDAMVAAHALSLDARLLTMNRNPFAAIAALDLQQWDA